MRAEEIVRYAILAASNTGSTWVNHVLKSHPCVVSLDEHLMNNASARALAHASPEAVERLLDDISERAASQVRTGGPSCARYALGLKLKAGERDVEASNLNAVEAALFGRGWRVLHLERENALDVLLSVRSRQQTGKMHCKTMRCDPLELNTSIHMPCNYAVPMIRALRERAAAFPAAFARWPALRRDRDEPPPSEPIIAAASRPGPFFMRLSYDELRLSARPWRWVMALLRLPAADTCILRDAHQKRVQQTQRELLSNYDELSACFARHASRGSRSKGEDLTQLLHPDERQTSGPMPVDDPDLCARTAPPASA